MARDQLAEMTGALAEMKRGGADAGQIAELEAAIRGRRADLEKLRGK